MYFLMIYLNLIERKREREREREREIIPLLPHTQSEIRRHTFTSQVTTKFPISVNYKVLICDIL